MSTRIEDYTLTVEEAARLLAVSRTFAYEAIRRDTFPVRPIRIGRCIRIPLSPLAALLGVDEAVARERVRSTETTP